jgi:hypothetical protein
MLLPVMAVKKASFHHSLVLALFKHTMACARAAALHNIWCADRVYCEDLHVDCVDQFWDCCVTVLVGVVAAYFGVFHEDVLEKTNISILIISGRHHSTSERKGVKA